MEYITRSNNSDILPQLRHQAAFPSFQGVDEYGVAVGIEIEMMGDRSATGQNKKKHEFMQVRIEE